MTYVLAYDIGTTGVKTCLFSLAERITLLDSAQEGYGLYLLDGGGAEQDPEEWWQAMCHTTKALFEKARSGRNRWRDCPSALRCRAWCWWTGRGGQYAGR